MMLYDVIRHYMMLYDVIRCYTMLYDVIRYLFRTSYNIY